MNLVIKYISIIILFITSNLFAGIGEDSLNVILNNQEEFINENKGRCLEIHKSIEDEFIGDNKYQSKIHLFGIYSNIVLKNHKNVTNLVDSLFNSNSNENDSIQKRAIYYKALAYSKMANPRKSVKILKKLLTEPFESKQLHLEVNKLLGSNLFSLKKYDESFSYLLKASKLAIDLGSMEVFFDIKSQIAKYYRSIGELERSIEYLKQGLDYFIENNDSTKIGSYYSNIGYSYLYQENLDSAKKYLLLAQSYFVDKQSYSFANQLMLYSSIYVMEDKVDSAFINVKKALDINLKLNNKKGLTNSYDMLHTYYLQFGNSNDDHIKSINFGKKTLEMISGEKNDSVVFHSIYKNISELYLKLGNKDSAIKYYEQYIIRLENINNKYNQNTINSLLESHDIEVKDLEISYKDEQLVHQKTRNYIVVVFLVLLILLLIIIYYQYRRNKNILFKILPEKIAKQVQKNKGNIGEHFDSASVLFIDIEGFTDYSKGKEPEFIIDFLNNTFQKFDILAEKHHIEKIKTIGDCYLAASGLPERRNNHLINLVNFALDALDNIHGLNTKDGWKVKFRFGMHEGHLVAGVLGKSKFTYDIWGETVNFAARLEEHGMAGKIHVSKEIKDKLGDSFDYEELKPKFFKGFDVIQTYYLSRKMNASNK